MATPPIVSNTDFYQYQNWQQVTTPDGSQTYYIIPGYGGRYVFDPFASDATGRITIYENPQPAYDAAAKQRKQAEEAVGTDAQLAQIAGTAAGAGTTYLIADAIGAEKFADSALGSIFGSSAPTTGGTVAGQAGANVAGQAGTQAGIAGGSASGGGGGGGALVNEVGKQALSEAGSEALGSTGFGSTGALSTGLGALGAAAGSYGLVQGLSNNSSGEAAAGALGLGMGLNGMGYALGPYGWAAMAMMAAAPEVAKLIGNNKPDVPSVMEDPAFRARAADQLTNQGLFSENLTPEQRQRLTEAMSLTGLLSYAGEGIKGENDTLTADPNRSMVGFKLGNLNVLEPWEQKTGRQSPFTFDDVLNKSAQELYNMYDDSGRSLGGSVGGWRLGPPRGAGGVKQFQKLKDRAEQAYSLAFQNGIGAVPGAAPEVVGQREQQKKSEPELYNEVNLKPVNIGQGNIPWGNVMPMQRPTSSYGSIDEALASLGSKSPQERDPGFMLDPSYQAAPGNLAQYNPGFNDMTKEQLIEMLAQMQNGQMQKGVGRQPNLFT